ncbi:lysostaphin resistance A-like protein [Prosthecobacter sp.]|uniref:lysostaphin resistance A-like protein n=1 Tax=Prosthecobacter sp. TaxID=1965333 RepID=UPI003784D7C2
MNDAAVPPPLPSSHPAPPRFSRLGAALALCVIAACVAYAATMHSTHREADETGVHPNRTMELMARYVVGVKETMTTTALFGGGQAGLEGFPVNFDEMLVQNLSQVSRSQADKLRLLIAKSWLSGSWPAVSELETVAAQNEGLQADVKSLQQMRANHGAVNEDDMKKLRARHGWFADLARARALPKSDAARQAVVQQSTQTAVVLICFSMLGLLLAVGGLVALILGIVQWRSGNLKLTLALRSRSQAGVLLEGFAIYLALFMFVPRLLRHMSVLLPPWAAYGPALLILILGMLWPLLRGIPRADWRQALGLHRGKGLLREVRAGLLGWVASLPLMVAGMIASSWIMRLTGDVPTHPIVDYFAGGGWEKLGAFLLAVVWAPVSEEIMFRGLLFPGLSAWLRWLAGMLVGAFVFAAIHPQGWAGVPPIMALAGGFSLLRMWRQSLIAPMTAHALNNGIMCLVMMFLWR